MADIAKRETRAEKERNRNEARVGLASNILGITAGSAALATASRNKAFSTGSVADAGPVTRRIAQRTGGRIGPKGVGRLVRAGAAGAVALQAANLGGDLIANRVLTREAQQKVKKDMRARNDQSVSAPVMGHGETGQGRNLELVGKADRMKCPKCDCECTSKGKCPECGMDCRKIEKAAAPKMGRAKCPNCEIPCDAEGKCPMCGKDCGSVSKLSGYDDDTYSYNRVGYGANPDKGRVLREGRKGILGIGRRPERRDERDTIAVWEKKDKKTGKVVGHEFHDGRLDARRYSGEYSRFTPGQTRDKKRPTKPAVAKAMRRFDSEADRQRRLGLYAGAGLATAAVAGDAARRQVTVVRGDQPKKGGKYVKGKRPVRGVALKPGVSPRKAAALAALALGGAAVGAGSYKRGVSRRNQPWA